MANAAGVTHRFLALGVVAAVVLTLRVAASQDGQSLLLPVRPGFDTVPNNILYIPPLAKAVLARDIGQVSKILDTREDINERVRAKEGVRAGFTPLILAASLSDPEITQMLVKRGARANVFDDFHRSAFWYAAFNESTDVTFALLGATGARDAVNAADDDFKRTPLHLAVHGNTPELAQLLLKLGASREQKDILGESAEDYCKRRSTEACAALQ
jgi:ankyrin repeat protein